MKYSEEMNKNILRATSTELKEIGHEIEMEVYEQLSVVAQKRIDDCLSEEWGDENGLRWNEHQEKWEEK